MIKRRKPLNKYSLKKIDSLNGEVKARIALCKRAGGLPITSIEIARRNDGTKHLIKRVKCMGGTCELCHQPARQGEILEPHELKKRSAGGKVSLRNSKMCHRKCHPVSKPRLEWIK